MGKKSNLIGEKFGQLTVVILAGYNKYKQSIWTCVCTCGTYKDIGISTLRSGATTSCGCKRKRKRPIASIAIDNLYKRYERGAKDRKLDFSLKYDEFSKLILGTCKYCGRYQNQAWTNPKTKQIFLYTGIDRIDNNLGYSLNNCTSCCKICNIAKSNLTEHDFKEWIDDLIRNNYVREFK